MQIRILPIHLVNKIAAGEVVERPASVVKELVENALDAGASRVDIVIEDGGRRLVQVTDDGGGMASDDLAMAFAPHATSKIAAEDDLYRIETMGFRGEALASIASISHASIRTRRAADDGGWEVEASGEAAGEPRPCPAAPGTTVTVADLFFNTPARRKFLRAAATELGHVVEQVARLALPQPQVAFRLTHNGREVKDLPAVGSTRQRVADLFGGELAEGLLPVSRHGRGIEVGGLVGVPASARATARWQYVFLNGRYIRDRSLAHALREAFRGRLDPNLNPVAFLFLHVDPGEVDVNVHPTKIEVRFRDSQHVHGELLACLKDALNRADLRPSATMSSNEPPAPPGSGAEDALETPSDPAAERRQQSLREALADFFKSVPATQTRLGFADAPAGPRRDSYAPHAHGPSPAPDRVEAQRDDGGRVCPGRLPDERPAPAGAGVFLSSCPEPGVPPSLTPGARDFAPRAVMQVHGAYIVAQADDGLVIADQHALHERLLYNELFARMAEGRLTGQRLLIPEPVRVTAGEAAALEAHAALLARLGVEVEQFGPETVAIQQFPSLLAERGVPAADFLRELLDRLAEDSAADAEHVLESILAIMACKAAVKAGSPLTTEEMQSLISRADQIEKASSCPHGRPTMLRLTLRDLEKQFHRT